MIIKFNVTETEHATIKEAADKEGLSISDYCRMKLGILDRKFSAAYAMELAKKLPSGKVFSVPDLYGNDWALVPNGVAGVIGRAFFKLADATPEIEYIDMLDATNSKTPRKHAFYERK